MLELTLIDRENLDAFSALMSGKDPSDYEIMIGAIEDNKAAGVALYNTLDDALMLDYIYVSEKFRRRGIGTALLEDFIAEIKEAGPVAVHINYPEIAQDLYYFTRARGFKIFRDGKAFRTPVKALLEAPKLKKLLKNPQKNTVKKLSELSRFEKSVLVRSLDAQDMEEGIINDSSLSKELSLVTIDSLNSVPSACILCRQELNQIVILYLVNFLKDPFQLVDLIRELKKRIEELSLTDCDLVFVTMDEDAKKLPETLLGGDELLISSGDVISAIRMI